MCRGVRVGGRPADYFLLAIGLRHPAAVAPSVEHALRGSAQRRGDVVHDHVSHCARREGLPPDGQCWGEDEKSLVARRTTCFPTVLVQIPM